MASDELDADTVERFKRVLESRFDELCAEIRAELLTSGDEQFIALAGRVHDPGEASVADLISDLNLAVIEQHSRELRAVDAALARVARGAYGICVECGGPIEIERLEAVPTTARCWECQAVHERSHAQPGRPTL